MKEEVTTGSGDRPLQAPFQPCACRLASPLVHVRAFEQTPVF